jgi:retron-type reverse transcriptase
VEANTDQPWVILYVKRWLKAPLQMANGSLAERDRGTPQGSAVSPVLANLFLHYAFDLWMARKFPSVPFERYVDDAVVHCLSERQARMLVQAIGERMGQVGLRLHPDKTRIVYCWDGVKTSGSVRAHLARLPGVHLPGQGITRPGRAGVHLVRAGDQQGRPEEDQ